MSEKDRLLKKAIDLNKKNKNDEVNKLLTEKILEKFNDASLFVEKAIALYKLNDIENSERYAKEGYKLDSNNFKINNYLAHINFNKKNYKIAEKYYKKAIELNPEIANSYNGLGNVYNELKDFVNAEYNYKKAIELNPNEAFFFNNLGTLYFIKNDFDNAYKYYQKAIDIDEKFSKPYNGLGNIYKRKNDLKKAKDNYLKAIELNHKNSAPFFNLASIQYDEKDFKKARENFLEKIKIENDENEYFTKIAKTKIEEIDNILESKQYEKIINTTSEIKAILHFNKGSITHYTGITIAKNLIIEESEFRLSEGAFLNDTSEGKVLFDYLEFDNSTQNNCEPNSKVFSKKPFIGSFVNNTKRNDLTLWRMYGKENLEEAKGCAITIDIDDLKKTIIQKLKTGNEGLKDFEELEFYKVAYLDNNEFNFSESKKSEIIKLNKLMQQLKQDVKEFKEKKGKKPQEALKIIELLNEVAYLFKNAEYQYESEVRLVMKDAVGFEKVVDKDFTPPKVYVELVSILSMIKQITIGPKVDRADEWAAAFHYHFFNKDLKPEISISNLPFK